MWLTLEPEHYSRQSLAQIHPSSSQIAVIASKSMAVASQCGDHDVLSSIQLEKEATIASWSGVRSNCFCGDKSCGSSTTHKAASG